MINTVIYTFTSQYTEALYPTLDVSKKMFMYINYYRASIASALKVGYDVEIYTSTDCVKYFTDLNIQINTVGDFNSYLFDFIKAYVLATRKEPFILVDGDIIFNKRLEVSNTPVLYEDKCYTGEDSKILDIKKDKTWHVYYKPYVELLTNSGIGTHIAEWTGQRLDFVHNIGLLYFSNHYIKKIVVDRWFEFNNFINYRCEHPDKIKFTAIGAQYLLTEVLNYYNILSLPFSKDSFTHNLGTGKFTNPSVPDSYILDNKSTLI